MTNANDAGPGSLRVQVDDVDAGGTVIIDAPWDPALIDDIPIDQSVTISGQGPAATSISGDANDRAFTITGPVAVTFADLAITGGNAPDGTLAGEAGEGGGGILGQGDVDLTLVRVTLANNHAGDGATGTEGGAGADGDQGGGGGSGGGLLTDGDLTLTDSEIENNTAGKGGDGGPGGAGGGAPGGNGGEGGEGGRGGAASADIGDLVSITGSTIDGNFAGVGGAGGAGGSGTPVGDGGDSGNGGHGGGLFGPDLITNSTLRANSAGLPGAVGTGTTLGDLGVGGFGGGSATTGAIEVDSSTVVANDAPGGPGNSPLDGAGGGIFSLGTLTLGRTILSQNTALVGGPCRALGFVNDGHNLIFPSDVVCAVVATNLDPDLGPLADNGGATKTMELLEGSPAIDQIPAAGFGCQPVDQRGVARPQPAGGACDIGAFERALPTSAPGPGAPPAGVVVATAPSTGQRAAALVKCKKKKSKKARKKCIKKARRLPV